MALYWLVPPAVLVIFLAFDSLRCWVTGMAQAWHRRLESRQRSVQSDRNEGRWCWVHTPAKWFVLQTGFDSPPRAPGYDKFLSSRSRMDVFLMNTTWRVSFVFNSHMLVALFSISASLLGKMWDVGWIKHFSDPTKRKEILDSVAGRSQARVRGEDLWRTAEARSFVNWGGYGLALICCKERQEMFAGVGIRDRNARIGNKENTHATWVFHSTDLIWLAFHSRQDFGTSKPGNLPKVSDKRNSGRS
ncbi:hypothetical protein C8J57DRAFT_1246393 [Mycena rebaudengoi]|nr:hypothetical protein C8J57DRAFT_1246393 [Mycena rebaudengoi]